MSFIYTSYRAFANFTAPLVKRYLHQRLHAAKEVEECLPQRWGHYDESLKRTSTHTKLYWVHGASLGESLAALPLIQLLKDSGYDVLLTYGTKTAYEILPKRLPAGVFHCFMPVDVPAWVQRFLSHWRPDCAVFIESEIWPALIFETMQRQIPLFLLNAKMSEKSFRRWSWGRPFINHILGAFTTVFVQDEVMAERYRSLGAKHIQVLGNIKFAAEQLPVNQELLARLMREIGQRPCWLAASFHAYEEDLVLDTHQLLRQSMPDMLTVLAPRKLDQTDSLYKKLDELGIAYVRHSQNASVAGAHIYIVDVMGEMGTFYQLAPVTYVGGSQPVTAGKIFGGHNPIEAALFGNYVCFGPEMSNVQMVAQDLWALGAGRVTDVASLSAFIRKNINSPRQDNLQKYALDKADILHKVVDQLINIEDRGAMNMPEHTKFMSFNQKPDFWKTENLLSKILTPCAKIYDLASQFVQSRKQTQKLGVPVICVGNVVVGGAGKTPTILHIARLLQSKGYTPHVIMRGYGRKRRDTLRVTQDRTVSDVGDEALMLCAYVPVWVTCDRVKAAKRAIERGATHILLDDGFQDRSIHKDASILVFDGAYGIGNGQILPAGPMRESLASALMRANVCLIIGDDKHQLAAKMGSVPCFHAEFDVLSKAPEKPVLAFAGIGSPQKFFTSLTQAGVKVERQISLPDHATYPIDLIQKIASIAQHENLELITTEKDAVKLSQKLDVPLHVFKVQLKTTAEFDDKVLACA